MDIMEMTRELGKALQQDDRYIAYMLAKQANDEDKELQEDIARFEDLRMNLGSAMASEEPDSDNIKALDTELKAVYQKVMKNPKMIIFFQSKQNPDACHKKVSEKRCYKRKDRRIDRILRSYRYT